MNRLVQSASLLALLFLCLAFRNAAGAGTQSGLTNIGGLNYSDYWGPYPVREINPDDKINLLGSIMSLQAPSTNLDIRLLLAIIAPGRDDSPRGYRGSLDVQVRSSTNETSPRNLLGSLRITTVKLDSDDNGPAPMHAKKLAFEALDAARSVYLYELTLHVPLQTPPTEFPEFVSIVSGMYNELDFWRWDRSKGKFPGDEPSPVARNRNPGPMQPKPGHPASAPATASAANTAAAPPAERAAAVPLPEVKLSLTREGGYLLITCMPAVTNAVLEETPLASSAWQWRPVMTGSNAYTAGWYVPPDDGARAFRVKIPVGPRE